jgi:lipoprotein-releasing system permease protein
MNRLELDIAWRYLRGRRGSRLLSLISTIAIGGVLVGVSALILVVSVMNGMQKDLREKILIGSPDLRVLTQGDDLVMEDWRPVLQRVKDRPGVVAVAPFVSKQTLITSGHEYADQASVMGILPQDPGVPDVTSIRNHAIVGDFRFRTGDSAIYGAVIGKLLAERLGVYPGNTIVLMAAPGGRLNVSSMMSGGLTPNVRKFEVSGIFETGLFEYDNTYVYIPLKAAQDLAGLGDDVTGLEVRTRSRDVAAGVAADIDTTLRWPYRTQDWQNQNDSLFRALNTEKLVMSFILLLIVGVAALNIVSTLTMVVSEKTREIGILRAMGLPARSVRNIFFVQGLVIGLVGTLLGLALGVGTAVALGRYELIHVDPRVYLIDHLPVALESGDVLLVVLASLAIAALATLYPAIQAAKLYPIDAIRHD